MIILVKSGNYGGNALRYAMEKEKSRIIKLNFLPEHITPIAIWNRMKLHCMQHENKHTHGRPIKDSMVSLVISPDPKEVEGWTDRDYKNLTDEVFHELDTVDISDLPKCKKCKPTNFRNSMSVAAQHNDSKSGVIHLHIDICRLDMDGNTNDLHQIHQRCMKAAENINRRHGWKQPADIREERRQQMTDDCLNVLLAMPIFNYGMYFGGLRRKGYAVEKRTDSKGKLCGYTLGIGATVIKASDLDNGHRLLASKLEATWKDLHKYDMQVTPPSLAAVTSSQEHVVQQPAAPVPSPRAEAPRAQPKPAISTININVKGKIVSCSIPNLVKDIFYDEAQLPGNVLWSKLENITHTAILLFCGIIDEATTIASSCGGGGSSDTKGWGRDKDEDDKAFARRCLALASRMHTRRSRGWHR